MKENKRLRVGMGSLAVTVLCLAAPAFAAVPEVAQKVASVDQQLLRGEWEAAAAAAREAVAKARLSPFGQDLALPVSRLALAEAGLGQTDSAVWHWQVSQNLDPHLLSPEALRGFGPPGELLDRNRLRPAGQPPAGLDVQVGADLHPRRLQGEEPKLSPQVAALPVPKWLRVQLVIDADGRPRDPVVLGGGLPGMTWEVLEAVRTWRFEPFQADGRPRAVLYQLVINPPARKPLLEVLPPDPPLRDVESLARAGDWKKAERITSRSWGKVLNRPSLDRHGLAAALALLALADAGNGREAEAICRWQAAQTLDPEIYHADLSPYGAPGALLARNRWGDAVPDLADWNPGVQGPALKDHAIPRSHPGKLEGNVLVAGVIDERGALRQPVALYAFTRSAQASREALEASALDAVCGWHYKPASASGRPVAMAQTVVFHYSPARPFFPSVGPSSGIRPPIYTAPTPVGNLPPPHIWEWAH